MAETRAQKLQRQYLEGLPDKPQPVKRVDVFKNFKDNVDVFWIYLRPAKIINPVPYKSWVSWNEINQIKFGKNTYHFGA